MTGAASPRRMRRKSVMMKVSILKKYDAQRPSIISTTSRIRKTVNLVCLDELTSEFMRRFTIP